jgi:hypothetical protein
MEDLDSSDSESVNGSNRANIDDSDSDVSGPQKEIVQDLTGGDSNDETSSALPQGEEHSTTSTPQVKARGYQLEMLDESLERNIITVVRCLCCPCSFLYDLCLHRDRWRRGVGKPMCMRDFTLFPLLSYGLTKWIMEGVGFHNLAGVTMICLVTCPLLGLVVIFDCQ